MNWLEQQTPNANAEKAFLLLGLSWGNGDAARIHSLRDDLLRDQNENGGWSQLPNLQPDAYATGLTLYALHQAGKLSTNDPRYQRGIEFLMKTQKEDGSWHVVSRSFKFQPYFESGFPHKHDQWISAAATGWPLMAMMQDLPDVK